MNNIRSAVLAAASGDLVTVSMIMICLSSMLMVGFQLIQGAKVKNKTCVPAGKAARIQDIFNYEYHGWDGDNASESGEDAGAAS